MGLFFNLIFYVILMGVGYIYAADVTLQDCREKGETTFLGATLSCTKDESK